MACAGLVPSPALCCPRAVLLSPARSSDAGERHGRVTALAPKRPCGHPGCPALLDGGESRCERHARDFELGRPFAAARGYGSRWRAARKRYLSVHPLCVMCLEFGRPRVAKVVDHVVPHGGDDKLFWDESNWQALCRHCHAIKTATSDGRWR